MKNETIEPKLHLRAISELKSALSLQRPGAK